MCGQLHHWQPLRKKAHNPQSIKKDRQKLCADSERESESDRGRKYAHTHVISTSTGSRAGCLKVHRVHQYRWQMICLFVLVVLSLTCFFLPSSIEASSQPLVLVVHVLQVLLLFYEENRRSIMAASSSFSVIHCRSESRVRQTFA